VPRALVPLVFVVAACGSVQILRSPTERLIDSIGEDPAAWEASREGALSDPSTREAVVRGAFDRVLELDRAARAAEKANDVDARDRARLEQSRYEEELSRDGEAAARHAVERAGGAGPEVRVALALLGRLDEALVVAAARDALTADTASRRRGALRVLEQKPSRVEAALDDAIARTADESWIVRREAATALAQDRSVRSGTALARLLADRDLLVAREAALGLGRRHAREWFEPLISFLERASASHDPLATDAAITALKEATGRDFPPDPKVWRRWVEESRPLPGAAASAPQTAPAPEPSR